MGMNGNTCSNIATLGYGIYTNYYYAVDKAGNSTPTNSIWVVCPAIPTGSIIIPADNTATNFNYIMPNVACTASVASPFTVTLVFIITNNAMNSPLSCNNTGGNNWGTASSVGPLPEGTNTLILKVVSDNGKTNYPATNTFIVDTIKPLINVSTVIPVLTNISSIAINVTGSDSGSGILQELYQADGGVNNVFSTTANGTINLNGFTDGAHTINIWALDKAGNSSIITNINFTVDTTPPDVEITSFTDGYLTSSIFPPLSGTTNETGSGVKTFWVTLNGINQNTSMGSWGVNAPMFTANFTNIVIAYIQDNAGNSKTITDRVIVDTNAPLLDVFNLADYDQVTNFTLAGSAEDDLSGISNITIITNGGNFDSPTLTGTNWTATKPLSVGFYNVIYVNVMNKVFNNCTFTVSNITVVNPGGSSPSISILTPVSGTTLNAPANIILTASTNGSPVLVTNVSYYNNGTLIGNSTNAPYNVLWPSLATGSYSVAAVAFGDDGATATNITNITVGAPTAADTNNGLILYYPFTAGSINDQSSSGLNGILSGSVTPTTDRFGVANNAYSFINGYIDPSPSTSVILQPSQSVSVSVWFYTTASTTGGTYIINEGIDNTDSWGYHLLMADNHSLQAWISAYPASGVYLIYTNIQQNTWYHAVMIYQTGVGLSLYINDTLVAAAADYSGPLVYYTSYGFNVGILADTWYPFNGYIDDIRVYNRAISSQEVDMLYHEGGW